MAVTIISLCAVLLSTLTFIATQYGTKRTATATYVKELEAKVSRLELRVAELQEENLRLMRMFLRKENL